MALLGLVYTGALNAFKEFNKDRHTEYILYECKTNENKYIPRNGDMVNIDNIILPLNYSNFTYNITIGGNIIFSIESELLFAISKVSYYKDRIIITLPENLFINEGIPLVSLVFHDCKIILFSENDFNYSINFKYIFFDNDIRRNLAQNTKNYVVKNFIKHIPDKQNNEMSKSINININTITSGYFITTKSKLTYVKFIVNGMILYEYDEFMLYGLGFANQITKNYEKEKINKVLLNNNLCEDTINLILNVVKEDIIYWIPNTKSFEWNSVNIDPNHINLCRIDKTEIQYKTEKNDDAIIYIMAHNHFITQSGLGVLRINYQ